MSFILQLTQSRRRQLRYGYHNNRKLRKKHQLYQTRKKFKVILCLQGASQVSFPPCICWNNQVSIAGWHTVDGVDPPRCNLPLLSWPGHGQMLLHQTHVVTWSCLTFPTWGTKKPLNRPLEAEVECKNLCILWHRTLQSKLKDAGLLAEAETGSSWTSH